MEIFFATFVKLPIYLKMVYGSIYNYIIVMKKNKISNNPVKFVINLQIIYKCISEIIMALVEGVYFF
jgi:hypothetical protein